MAESGGLAPQPENRSNCVRNSARTSAGSLSKNGGEQWSCPTSLAARNGFQPITALRGFALRKMAEARGHAPLPARAGPIRFKRSPESSSGFASESPRGRICTCVDPLRRRRPELLGHAEQVDLAAGLPPATRFEAPHDGNFTTRGKMVPLPGLAPGSRPSQSRVMAISPQGESGVPPKRNSGNWLQSCSLTASTSRTRTCGSPSSFCIISNTRSLQPARQ